MINYVKSRYGDPIAADQHEISMGWYDNGGYLKPGYTMAFNGTGQAERVTTQAQDAQSNATLQRIEKKFDRLIDVTRQVPAGVGQHVGSAINGSAHDASFRARYPR